MPACTIAINRTSHGRSVDITRYGGMRGLINAWHRLIATHTHSHTSIQMSHLDLAASLPNWLEMKRGRKICGFCALPSIGGVHGHRMDIAVLWIMSYFIRIIALQNFEFFLFQMYRSIKRKKFLCNKILRSLLKKKIHTKEIVKQTTNKTTSDRKSRGLKTSSNSTLDEKVRAGIIPASRDLMHLCWGWWNFSIVLFPHIVLKWNSIRSSVSVECLLVAQLFCFFFLIFIFTSMGFWNEKQAEKKLRQKE